MEAITITSTLILLAFLFLQARKMRAQSERFRDQLRAADQRISKSKAQLEEVTVDSQVSLDALSDAYFLITSDLEVKRTNKKAKEIFRNEDLIGRPLDEILMSPAFSTIIARMVQDRVPCEEKLTLTASGHSLGGSSQEGETAWIIQCTPLPNHIRNPQTCIILRDISTEHQTDMIRTDFVANASHELRTPLAIINGYLENLLDDDVLEEPKMARKMLGTMRKHGQRLSRLIDDMLVVSRLESGENAAINREPFDMIDCCNDVIERLEQIIQNSNTNLEKNFSVDSIILNGDRFYWTQVLFNLIENAIKQNPSRELTVTLSIEVTDNQQLRIKISDNGIGIPSSHLPFIFKRFYRVDKHHTQSDIKGTGLGLSIVKRAIEAHSGTINVTSQPGIDTTFTIVTPLDCLTKNTPTAP
ncbi:sensor histidine kinase [Rubritalea marina]|uniref:sensor histidine kinase n=1 Tax=Rubritalea marina TaxID=361055 RepID=UPI00036F8853|nr:ATP-binding protein [Rubritalea marina]